QPPLLGEARAPRPPPAIDEPAPDDRLERGDLLAHRRLDVAEPNGGRAERALFGHGLERYEMPELRREPAVGDAVSCTRHGWPTNTDTRSPVFRLSTTSVRLRSQT